MIGNESTHIFRNKNLEPERWKARTKKKRKGYATTVGLWNVLKNIIHSIQVINVQLADIPTHKTKSSIAELTRPARALKNKYKAENKKPQGWKKTKTTENAKYHNCFNPLGPSMKKRLKMLDGK